jgi:hypothetical protein
VSEGKIPVLQQDILARRQVSGIMEGEGEHLPLPGKSF